jgi:hypothetical protein
MKAHNDSYKGLNLRIEVASNGFIVMDHTLAGNGTMVFLTFEQAVNEVARIFGLMDIGERVVLSATKEFNEQV